MKNYLTRKNNEGRDLGFSLFDDFDDFFAPSIFGRNFAPSFFNGNVAANSMRTDVKETENGYSLSVDMPGFDKKDIGLTLKNGYLTVNAEREDKEEDDKNYVRRERSVSCSRSFYVGEEVTEEDVKAKYNNGTLVVDVPKKDKKELSHKNIEIE